MAVETPKLVRPEFVEQMERELLANQRKGDWRDWKPTMLEALAELQHHQAKLTLAMADGDHKLIQEYSADMANISMKIHEEFGTT